MLGRTLPPVVAVEHRDVLVVGVRKLHCGRLEVLDIGIGLAGLGAVVAQLGQVFEPGGVLVPPADPGLGARMLFAVEVAGQPPGGQVHLGALEQDLHRRVESAAFIVGRDDLREGLELVAAEGLGHDVHRWCVPAGVHHAQSVEVEPQRQGLEPLDVELLLGGTELVEEVAVLLLVFFGVGPQEPTAAGGILDGVGDGVELVVAHHDLGGAGVDHRLDQLQGSQLFAPAIDQIADEDCGALGVGIDATVGAVAEAFQALFKQRCHAVNVADDVITTHDPMMSRGCDSQPLSRIHDCGYGAQRLSKPALRTANCVARCSGVTSTVPAGR